MRLWCQGLCHHRRRSKQMCCGTQQGAGERPACRGRSSGGDFDREGLLVPEGERPYDWEPTDHHKKCRLICHMDLEQGILDAGWRSEVVVRFDNFSGL